MIEIADTRPGDATADRVGSCRLLLDSPRRYATIAQDIGERKRALEERRLPAAEPQHGGASDPPAARDPRHQA